LRGAPTISVRKGSENPTIGLAVIWQSVEGSWDPVVQFEPSFIVQVSQEIGDNITKRKISSISARMFDPIDFLAPNVL
jgi:hypothetical protein